MLPRGSRAAFIACLLCLAAIFAESALGQTFNTGRLILTASDPTILSKGDFNGDGKIDLAYLDTGSTQALHILLGNGDGAFTRKQDIALPLGMDAGIVVADINADGIPDIVLGGNGPTGQIGVLLGNGDGTFQPPIISTFTQVGSAWADLRGIGAADFNGDGAMDLAVTDALNEAIYILEGNNTGSFTLESHLPGGPGQIFTADLNGDGHQDFIYHGALASAAIVYLGNGDGSFQAGVTYAGSNNISSMVLQDVDGDGHPDLVTSGFYNTIAIWHGNADGTFTLIPSAGSSYGGPGPVILAVHDFNSDGILDIAAATGNGITILYGKGNLTYSSPVPFSGSSNPNSAIMADFNGDGREDFAEIAPGGIAIVLGSASGGLESPELYDIGEPLNSVQVADFNGDHLPDIAVNVPEPSPRILLNAGKGAFTVPADSNQPASSIGATYMVTGDFDGDGKPDIALSGLNGASVFFGKGDGTLSAPVTPALPSQTSYGVAAVGDFNNDGTTDIATLEYEALDILLGQRNDTFTVNDNYFFSLASSNGAATGDFNHDGKLDLVVTQVQVNNLQIMLGKGDGTFSLGAELSAINLPQSIVTADVDGDGNLDIVACLGFFNTVQIFYGNGDGTFQPPVAIPLQRQYAQMAIADMDGDGKPDLVLSDGSLIAIIRNTGNRTFGPEQHYLAGFIANFTVADVNGDGLPDIIVANGATGNSGNASTTVTVMLNQGANGSVTGVLGATPATVTYAQPFAISLSLSPAANLPVPTGTIEISIDGTPVSESVLSGPSVSYSDSDNPPLTVGAHKIVATYSGDQNYIAATFGTKVQIVPVIYPTTVAESATPNPSLASQTVRFTASVTSPGQNVNYPNNIGGTVVFRDGTTNLGAVTLNASAVAVFDTALLGPGTHSVTASYLGYSAQAEQTGSFAPSTSVPVAILVYANPTSTALSVNPPSQQVGGLISLAALVTSSAGTPTGAVTFSDGANVLSVQPLDANGNAVLSTAFAATGTHSLTANYQANATFAASASGIVSLNVSGQNQSNVSTTKISAAQNAQVPNGLTLTATVAARFGSAEGQVTFMDGAEPIATVPLNANGVGRSSVALTRSGLHYLSAVYAGNREVRPSVSPVMLEMSPLAKPDFSLNLSATSIALRGSQPVSVTISVDPVNGFGDPLSLSCAANTPDLACTLTRSTLQNGGGTSVLTIAPIQNTASFIDFQINQWLHFAVWTLGIFAALILAWPSRRRMAARFVCATLLLGVAGCGAPRIQSFANIPSPGSYLLSVQAASSGSNAGISHTAELQITVRPPAR